MLVASTLSPRSCFHSVELQGNDGTNLVKMSASANDIDDRGRAGGKQLVNRAAYAKSSVTKNGRCAACANSAVTPAST